MRVRNVVGLQRRDIDDQLEPLALTSAMAGIGIGFAAAPVAPAPNIEDTLLFASVEAMDGNDLRVAASSGSGAKIYGGDVSSDGATGWR